MPSGISIHIGLNHLDSAHYGGPGTLAACEADALAMQAIAKKRGFAPSLLLTEKATAHAVTEALSTAAKKLRAGDALFLTYSGHGGQVPDRNGDEKDGLDETWALYDRQLVDDELYALWGRFAKGVRIFMLSDSCHSGTASKDLALAGADPAVVGAAPAARALPLELQSAAYRDHKRAYDRIQKDIPSAETVPVRATVLLVSGCQDNQLSLDGEKNGLFTATFLRVWNGGRFRGSYRRLHREILALMPQTQSPKYSIVGAPNKAFEAQRPLTI